MRIVILIFELIPFFFSWSAFSDDTSVYIATLAASAASSQPLPCAQVEAVVPALLKQDPRYFRIAQGGFLKRSGYAVSRIWVTRTDAGHRTFNLSEIGGAGLSSALSNAYYPVADRSWSATATRWASQVMWDAVSNELKEFWPDLSDAFSRVFHREGR